MTARSPLLLVPVVLASLGGCVDSDTFYIIQMQIPQAGCKISATQDPVSLAEGVLDISLGVGYQGYPLVINNLVGTEGTDNQPERNTVHFKGFQIRVDLGSVPAGGIDSSLLNYLDRKAQNAITPGGGTIAGPADLIKDDLAKALQPVIPEGLKADVLVGIRAEGDVGGSTVESGEFLFPITLCKKCLVEMRATCPTTDDKTAFSNACGRPQDSPVTCCQTSFGVDCLASAQ